MHFWKNSIDKEKEYETSFTRYRHVSGMNFKGDNQTVYIEKAEEKNTFFIHSRHYFTAKALL